MSLYIDFEPHSWYRGFAIKDCRDLERLNDHEWEAYTDDSNSYQIIELGSYTLRELKLLITQYRSK